MRNGKVYELPTQGPRIIDSEFSSLPIRLFDTPDTMPDLPNSGSNRKNQIAGLGNQAKSFTYAQQEKLIPTPTTRDYKDRQSEHQREGVVQTDTVARAIFNSGEVLLPTTRAQNGEDRNNKIWARDPSKPQNLENALAVTLLPTTRTSMANGPTQKEIKAGNPKTQIETEVMLGETSWGKFEPAIRRWEKTLGRPSPLPTKPDGKDGGHRLSSAFTEWMMGLPEGWVTGVGLTRNDELKACGNGVVPQQAELALRVLLEGLTIPSTKNSKLFATPNTMDSLPPRYGEAYEKVKNAGGRKNRESSGNLREQVVHVLPGNPGEITMLPTPTVSDTYTDNLKSTQQKEGSMHSVTLPQAVRVLSDKIEVGQRREPLTYKTDSQSIGRDKSTAEDRQR
jgi:hypothetical protein